MTAAEPSAPAGAHSITEHELAQCERADAGCIHPGIGSRRLSGNRQKEAHMLTEERLIVREEPRYWWLFWSPGSSGC